MLLCFSLLLFVSQHLGSVQSKVALFSDSDTKPFILEASTIVHETVDHKPIMAFSADLFYSIKSITRQRYRLPWGQWGHGPLNVNIAQNPPPPKKSAVALCALHKRNVHNEFTRVVVFIVSGCEPSRVKKWSERNKKLESVPACLGLPHPQMSHISMSDPRALKAFSCKDVDAL